MWLEAYLDRKCFISDATVYLTMPKGSVFSSIPLPFRKIEQPYLPHLPEHLPISHPTNPRFFSRRCVYSPSVLQPTASSISHSPALLYSAFIPSPSSQSPNLSIPFQCRISPLSNPQNPRETHLQRLPHIPPTPSKSRLCHQPTKSPSPHLPQPTTFLSYIPQAIAPPIHSPQSTAAAC